MSSKLKKLIAHYEAERAALTAQIDECIQEAEYKMAHRLDKGLTLVGHKLRVLQNFQNKFHDDKEQIARWLRTINDETDGEYSSYMRSYFLKKIQEMEQKIKRGQEAQKMIPDTPSYSGLQDVLLMLLAGKIRQFEFMIDDDQQIYCAIRLVRKTLIISVPEIRRHRRNGIFRTKQLRHMQRLGFRLYDDQNELMHFLPYSEPEETGLVKSILAQLVFDVFYFKNFTGNAYVRYFE